MLVLRWPAAQDDAHRAGHQNQADLHKLRQPGHQNQADTSSGSQPGSPGLKQPGAQAEDSPPFRLCARNELKRLSV